MNIGHSSNLILTPFNGPILKTQIAKCDSAKRYFGRFGCDQIAVFGSRARPLADYLVALPNLVRIKISRQIPCYLPCLLLRRLHSPVQNHFLNFQTPVQLMIFSTNGTKHPNDALRLRTTATSAMKNLNHATQQYKKMVSPSLAGTLAINTLNSEEIEAVKEKKGMTTSNATKRTCCS